MTLTLILMVVNFVRLFTLLRVQYFVSLHNSSLNTEQYAYLGVYVCFSKVTKIALENLFHITSQLRQPLEVDG
jgi:hypothetical protein